MRVEVQGVLLWWSSFARVLDAQTSGAHWCLLVVVVRVPLSCLPQGDSYWLIRGMGSFSNRPLISTAWHLAAHGLSPSQAVQQVSAHSCPQQHCRLPLASPAGRILPASKRGTLTLLWHSGAGFSHSCPVRLGQLHLLVVIRRLPRRYPLAQPNGEAVALPHSLP